MLNQMEKVNKAFMKAFEDQNPEAIADLFTDDCKILPNGQDVVVGKKVIICICDRICQKGSYTRNYKY